MDDGPNKQTARELFQELQEVLKRYPDRIDQVDENGPVIKIITDGLGKAISSIKTTIQP